MTKVKSGDEISLGTKILQLLEAYMLHWPDSMFTYVKEDQLLLPNGGFGQLFASYQRFDDELPAELLTAGELFDRVGEELKKAPMKLPQATRGEDYGGCSLGSIRRSRSRQTDCVIDLGPGLP